jgi:hypothetical protein
MPEEKKEKPETWMITLDDASLHHHIFGTNNLSYKKEWLELVERPVLDPRSCADFWNRQTPDFRALHDQHPLIVKLRKLRYLK